MTPSSADGGRWDVAHSLPSRRDFAEEHGIVLRVGDEVAQVDENQTLVERVGRGLVGRAVEASPDRPRRDHILLDSVAVRRRQRSRRGEAAEERAMRRPGVHARLLDAATAIPTGAP
jgi:hypothetical protein